MNRLDVGYTMYWVWLVWVAADIGLGIWVGNLMYSLGIAIMQGLALFTVYVARESQTKHEHMVHQQQVYRSRLRAIEQVMTAFPHTQELLAETLAKAYEEMTLLEHEYARLHHDHPEFGQKNARQLEKNKQEPDSLFEPTQIMNRPTD